MGCPKITYRYQQEVINVPPLFVIGPLEKKEGRAETYVKNTPYRFNAKEVDPETGLYYYGARYYNPMTSVWLSVDRFADKYPSMTPYNAFGNNPIRFIDLNGDSLDVALNKASKESLLSVVSKENRGRININDNGNVSIDFSGLSEKEKAKMLKNDRGLSAINDAVEGNSKMLFEVGNITTVNTSKGNQAYPYPVIFDPNGVVNASNNGKDSNGGNTFLPQSGYDGQVTISFDGEFTSGGRDARNSVVFHELREMYYRTELGYDYYGNNSNGGFGAHYRASQDEGRYFGNSNPGSAAFRRPSLTWQQKAIFPLIMQNRMK